jgi:hypothetical protein
MAFHVVAFQSTQAEDGAYLNLEPVIDPTVSISGNYIYVPELNNLVGFYICAGSKGSGAYFQAPSLRKLLNIDVGLIELATTPEEDPALNLFPESPIPLERYEGLEVLLNTGATTDETHTAIVFLSDGAIAPVSGDIRTLRASASISATPGEWSEGTLTFRQTLPVGTYQVVGAKVIGENIVAFRFVPIGYAWRPGGIASPTLAGKVDRYQRYGRLGIWFTFDSRTPPSLEILTSGSSTSQVVLLDLIKVA